MLSPDPFEQWQNEKLTDQARAELASETAQQSFRVGLQAWAEGAYHKAWDWLERANRQAPNNAHVLFALAMARYAVKDVDGSKSILKILLEKNDFYEGWVFLFTLMQNTSAMQEAMQALTHLLCNFGHTQEISFISNVFCKNNNLAGWCGLSGNGQLHWGGEIANEQPVVWLDGQKHTLIHKKEGLFCPEGWREAESLYVSFPNKKQLLGGHFNVKKIIAYEGLVSSEEDCLQGWIWYPYDAETTPILTLSAYNSKTALFQVKAEENKNDKTLKKPFAKYRQFSIPSHRLPQGLVHVLGPDGRDMPGSPLVVSQGVKGAARLAVCVGKGQTTKKQQASHSAVLPFFPIPYFSQAHKKPISSRKNSDLAIIIPVYDHYDSTMACLVSVYKSVQGQKIRVVIVNDASPDEKLTVDVKKFCNDASFIYCHHEQNKGFPSAVNTGLRVVPQCDVILLNSDTLVPEGWWQALRKVAYAEHTTGTVTPLSNNASILSYPSDVRCNAMPTERDVSGMMLAAQAANKNEYADIPTGNGFCLYIRHDCLHQTGYFREDVFAQGYGEETDFCLRAHALGWKHKAALGVYVAHHGGFSFGEKRLALMERNEAVLESLHPGYHEAVAQWVQKKPLWQAKRRLDIVRFRSHPPQLLPAEKMVLLVTHQHGGGVEHVVQQRVAFYQKKSVKVFILRPHECGCFLEDPQRKNTFPSLFFRFSEDTELLKRLLLKEGLRFLEVHHLSEYYSEIYDLLYSLNREYSVYVHDYAFFCQRVSLLGPDGEYCGEPEAAVCEKCIAIAGRHVKTEQTVNAYLARSAKLLAQARAVYTPSHDAASRMTRHFSSLTCRVVPLQKDKNRSKHINNILREKSFLSPASGALLSPQGGGAQRVRLCVVGAIGREKGYDVLYHAALDAALNNLPLEFVIVGHTPNDQLLLNTGRIFITGPYQEKDAVSLIQSFQSDAAFFPSIWPETWCLTLGLAWQAGLPAFVFDHGAPAERVRHTRRGWLLNSKLRASELNQVLINTVLGCKNSNDRKNHNPLVNL